MVGDHIGSPGVAFAVFAVFAISVRSTLSTTTTTCVLLFTAIDLTTKNAACTLEQCNNARYTFFFFYFFKSYST
jgi:hypothetical protein